MGWYEDRQRALEWLGELESALGGATAREASPDARLTGFAAAATAEALLLFADTLQQSVQTLRDDVIPQMRDAFGDR